jgi:TolB-like protein
MKVRSAVILHVRLFFCIILFVFRGVFVYSVDIVMLPLSYYERESNGWVRKKYDRDIRRDLEEYINRYHTVRFDDTSPYDERAGITESDVRASSERYQSNYVLYGLMKRESNALYMELKLYNQSQRKDELFFASDRFDSYDRMIKGMSDQILDWYHTDRDKIDSLKEDIAVLKEDIKSVRIKQETATSDVPKPHVVKEKKEKPVRPPREKPPKEFTLRFPIHAGYWTYVESGWTAMVQGTVEGTVGVEIVPELQFPAIGGLKNELSLSFTLGYRFGLNPRPDTILRVHDIIINPGITYHLNIYNNNWLLIGSGVFYEQGLWHIEQSKYNTIHDYSQSLTGVSTTVGYSYHISKMFTVDMGVNMYFYFTADTSPIVRAYVGTVITILGGLYER